MGFDDENPNRDRASRAAAELKQTEDLLAGFDRPARPGRQRTPAPRDFVDYHSDRQPRPSRLELDLESEASDDRARRDLPTAIIPRKERRFPRWLPWAATLCAMAIGGVLVAAAITSRSGTKNSGSPTAASGSAPLVSSSFSSAATTLTSATEVSPLASYPSRHVPSSPIGIDPKPVGLGPSSAPAKPSVPDDFLRKM